MADKALKISSPWVVYYDRLNALFKYDHEVSLTYDWDKYEIKVFVDNPKKADALMMLLPPEKSFGNITVKTTVVPANDDEGWTWTEIFKDAFDGNPVFSYAQHVDSQMGKLDYVVFAGIVAQYFADNLFDIGGNISELYEDIAREIFETGDDSVFYCTDTPVLGSFTTEDK